MLRRAAKINTLWLMLLCAGGGVAVLAGLLSLGGPGYTDDAKSLQVYCAAGLRVPMEEIARKYEEEYGVRIEFDFDGSNTLLNKIQVNKMVPFDLYLTADESYAVAAVDKGLAAETIPVAHQRPVVAVRKDSEVEIESLADLLRDDIAVSMGDPERAAIGRSVKEQLSKIPMGEGNAWEILEQNVIDRGVFKPTVNDSANDAKIGKTVDAAIVWDSTVAMPKYRDTLRAIPLPELETEPNLVTICVLTDSPKSTSALKFARYVAARDRGLPVFEEYGTRPVEGDVWAEHPQIKFYCGAVNERAVEPIIVAFERREGVSVDRSYDGCGFLTGKMKVIADQRTDLGFPDVYMACDVYYLENVKDWFQEAANVSDAEIVIAVPKGSDKVQSVDDLIKPGVRVTVGEPDQCTIGALTRRLLQSKGLYEKLKAKQRKDGETVVEKGSSAQLVPDILFGHADAVVAYITDVNANRDEIDIVRIDSPLNRAIQPFSIAKTSDHKYLLRRLFKQITESPQAFEDAGFHFRLGEAGDDADEGDADSQPQS